jgi:hypothetical protein
VRVLGWHAPGTQEVRKRLLTRTLMGPFEPYEGLLDRLARPRATRISTPADRHSWLSDRKSSAACPVRRCVTRSIIYRTRSDSRFEVSAGRRRRRDGITGHRELDMAAIYRSVFRENFPLQHIVAGR